VPSLGEVGIEDIEDLVLVFLIGEGYPLDLLSASSSELWSLSSSDSSSKSLSLIVLSIKVFKHTPFWILSTLPTPLLFVT